MSTARLRKQRAAVVETGREPASNAKPVRPAGTKLAAPATLLPLISDFLRWAPIPPKTARQLAQISARLCRLLRDEVIEQMARGSPALTGLAQDWRKLLFPQADDAQFADGYAQAVTFGLLVARAREFPCRAAPKWPPRNCANRTR